MKAPFQFARWYAFLRETEQVVARVESNPEMLSDFGRFYRHRQPRRHAGFPFNRAAVQSPIR